MAIIMISSPYQGGGPELAQVLARKTNWPVLSREQLQEEARKAGIKVGRLETAMIRSPGNSEKLARERNLYLAFLTEALCDAAGHGNMIYTGRAGHLLLPGVSHRLRVGLTAPRAGRIQRTAQALKITPEKAEIYLNHLDEDVDKWMRYVHHENGYDPSQFDAFFNLETLGLSNAAGLLCEMATLPDFQPTPASMTLMADQRLAARARLRLAQDERTHTADLNVQADNGVLTVTYPPHQEALSRHIPQVLADLPDCSSIQCTMAETNILWVQERFDPKGENFKQLITLSQRWGAALELMRLLPADTPTVEDAGVEGAPAAFGRQHCSMASDGGVEDDEPGAERNDGGLGRTEEALVRLGRYGGRHSVCGGANKILERANSQGKYSLVVIGDMFLAKGHSTRTRQTRELALSIRDRLKAPVITADELKSRFLFGKRQAFTLVGYLALTVLAFILVFTHQKPVLDFLSGPFHQAHKWIAPLVMVVFIPLIAYIYGTVTGLGLKIINID
jgi:hypothetical protein